MTGVRAGDERSWALRCSVTHPGLEALLLLDADRTDALAGGAELAALLASRSGGPVRRVVLGSTESEDDLWTSVRRTDDGDGLVPDLGPLVRRPDEAALVVVVPDLARLSLAAARAATAMIGAPRVALERDGQSHDWAARTFWVAACAAADVGRVSPHLLDRFVVRVPRRVDDGSDRVEAILAALAGTEPSTDPTAPAIEPAAPPTTAVEIDADALTRAIRLAAGPASIRRALTLVRLAVASARLLGAPRVGVAEIDDAAVLTGLLGPRTPAAEATEVPAPAQPASPSGASAPEPVAPSPAASEPPVPTGAQTPAPAQRAAGSAVTSAPASAPVLVATTAEDRVLDAAPVGPVVAYPEDTAGPARELTPLTLPPRPAFDPANGRGVIIGSVAARSLHDLAWVATLRQAALYQRFRRRTPGSAGLRIAPSDLRAHRRLPEPRGMLVLVLDHTARRGWDWVPALAPYLAAAYESRHAVTVVEVGAADALSPLRAERLTLRSVLDPRLLLALDRPAGCATPLAHGLVRARAAAEQAMRRGTGSVRAVELVVVTDALGNVPLAASLADITPRHVTDEGVTDALACAEEIRELDHVRTVTIEPAVVPHPEILLRFAAALSADRTMVRAS